MKLKQRPEDFVVEEVSEFVPTSNGRFHIYRLWKRGLSTLEVLDILTKRYKVPANSLQVCGLKDKHAESTQLVSARDKFPAESEDERWTLTHLGQSESPVGSRELIGNRFRVTVRSLMPAEVERAKIAVERAAKGIVNYFDSQRFGSVRHGQGFAAKKLIAGDFEGAVRLFLTARCGQDRAHVRKRKMFIEEQWGNWDMLAEKVGRSEEKPVLRHLAGHPRDWLGAFMKIGRQLRALIMFAYQSYIWNETAKALLAGRQLRQLAADYIMGEMYFADAEHELPAEWMGLEVPLPRHSTQFATAEIRAAVNAVLAREGLTQAGFRIPQAQKLYFKEVPRPLVLKPLAIDWQPLGADPLNRGRQAGLLILTLPPGAYATLFVKRIFQTRPGPDSPNYVPTTTAPADRADAIGDALG